jgi:hypothetical protein
MKLLVVKYTPTFYYLFLFDLSILLNILFYNTLSLSSSLDIRDQIPTHTKQREKLHFPFYSFNKIILTRNPIFIYSEIWQMAVVFQFRDSVLRFCKECLPGTVGIILSKTSLRLRHILWVGNITEQKSCVLNEVTRMALAGIAVYKL